MNHSRTRRRRHASRAPPAALVLSLVLASPASLVPATDGTLRVAGSTTLTENHTGRVIIEANDVVLDCDHHRVSGDGRIGAGIELVGRAGVTVRKCMVEGFEHGILLHGSWNNFVYENTVARNTVGLHLRFSSNGNEIHGNVAADNIVGYDLFSSSANRLHGNTARDNVREGFLLNGFSPEETAHNFLERNVSSGNGYGYGVLAARDNSIFHNDIIDNAQQVFSLEPGANHWHHPVWQEGNYWSDYTGADDGSGSDKHAITGDGIGDSHTPWPAEGFDGFPFMLDNAWMPLVVAIDIKPGDEANTVNLGSAGSLPVALFGSDTLDVRLVDQPSLRLSGAPVMTTGAGARMCREAHVDRDRQLDLVCHFTTRSIMLGRSGPNLTLRGRTHEGRKFHGAQTIRVVPRQRATDRPRRVEIDGRRTH